MVEGVSLYFSREERKGQTYRMERKKRQKQKEKKDEYFAFLLDGERSKFDQTV